MAWPTQTRNKDRRNQEREGHNTRQLTTAKIGVAPYGQNAEKVATRQCMCRHVNENCEIRMSG
eukprot:2925478-Pyramimonas_sp.AAC.1